MSRVPTLDDEEYLEIEEAVATTVRGRAFLRMRDRRASLISASQGRHLVSEIANLIEARETQRSSVASLDLMQRDLRDLRDHIERSKSEIAALVGKDGKGLSGARINGATEELYEIVASTERATSEILGAAEWIQERIGTLGIAEKDRQEFESRCMDIFTACSFQDITGQRIAKVVATMSYVEQRVNTMMSMWDAEGDEGSVVGVHTGIGAGRPNAPADLAVAPDDAEKSLLNGPQLPGHGLGQDAVDALFGEAKAESSTPAAEKSEAAAKRLDTTPQEPPPAKAPAAARPAAAKSAAPPPAASRQVAASPPQKLAKPAPVTATAAAATAQKVASANDKKMPDLAKLDQSAVDALFN